MWARLNAIPVLVALVGISALAMLLPAVHAATQSDWPVARAFVQSSILFALLFAGLSLAWHGRSVRRAARAHLVALIGAYTLVPLVLAVPLLVALPALTFFQAWFEMVSSLTTTGATLLPSAPTVSESVHLWRATVGWAGGFLAWLMAAAIFAPLNLGGFEVTAGSKIGRGLSDITPITRVADSGERLRRFALDLGPIYLALTVALWLGLILSGSRPFVALCHAMATLSTSGISPVGGLGGSAANIWGEVLIAAFLIFALSRATFRPEERGRSLLALRQDPELATAGLIILAVVVLLFLRHWVDPRASQWSWYDALVAIWGTFFTALSFLTTTGFEGSGWQISQSWSGLQTPALILMALALIGGGVATTAGGVKLLRVYALYKHGSREVERLVHPSSIGGAGAELRRIRRQGAQVAWIFFMLFAISIAVTAALLALTGLDFRASMILTIAGLSTTGPLATVTGETPISIAALGPATQAVYAAAMIVGRLETLVLIALLNPAPWRS